MPRQDKYNFFTGTQGGLSGYLSHGVPLARKTSSLTGERVKTDPAFQGLLRSSNRLKEASGIASALYKQIPEGIKEFNQFRFLTAEAILLLKQGLDKSLITEMLEKRYIIPFVDECVKWNLPQYKSLKKNNPVNTPGTEYKGRVQGYRKLKLWNRSTNEKGPTMP